MAFQCFANCRLSNVYRFIAALCVVSLPAAIQAAVDIEYDTNTDALIITVTSSAHTIEVRRNTTNGDCEVYVDYSFQEMLDQNGNQITVSCGVVEYIDVYGGAGSPWADEVGYANQAKGKLVYGVKNVLLGWTELFTQPHEAIQNGENVFVGLGKGVWNGVGQTVGGALHAITFPIPAIDVPLPEGGTQVFQ